MKPMQATEHAWNPSPPFSNTKESVICQPIGLNWIIFLCVIVTVLLEIWPASPSPFELDCSKKGATILLIVLQKFLLLAHAFDEAVLLHWQYGALQSELQTVSEHTLQKITGNVWNYILHCFTFLHQNITSAMNSSVVCVCFSCPRKSLLLTSHKCTESSEQEIQWYWKCYCFSGHPAQAVIQHVGLQVQEH